MLPRLLTGLLTVALLAGCASTPAHGAEQDSMGEDCFERCSRGSARSGRSPVEANEDCNNFCFGTR